MIFVTSAAKEAPAEYKMHIFYSFVNGLVFGLEHTSFKGGSSVILHVGFIQLHMVIFNGEEE